MFKILNLFSYDLLPTLTEVLESSQGQQKELAASSRSSQPQQMRQQQSELVVQNAKSNVLPLNAEEISEADWSLYTFYLSFFYETLFQSGILLLMPDNVVL